MLRYLKTSLLRQDIIKHVFQYSLSNLLRVQLIQIQTLLRYSLSLPRSLLNLGRGTTLISLFRLILLLRVISISLSLSLAFLITSIVFRITTLELLSPSSIAILTKINSYSTQSITASLVYLYNTNQLLVITLTYLIGLSQGRLGS